MYELISGAIMMACFVSGIFFIKFWKKTQDKLFLMFAAAFWILSLERLVLGYLGTQQELGPKIYLIRLTAFVLILVAIVQKNRESEKG
jgi:uncharacterized membrane protein